MIPTKVKFDINEKGVPADFPINIADGNWKQYLPPYLGQLLKWDTNGCTHISSIYYCLSAYANYLLATNQWPQAALDFFNANGYIVNGSFEFSWEYNACLDGTSINGNIAQNAWKSVAQYGLIPLSMLQMNLEESLQFPTQEAQDAAYYAPSRVTLDMHALGAASLKFFTLAWRWVGDGTVNIPLQTLQNALQTSPVQIVIPIPSPVELWNEQNVPYTGGTELAHCDCMYCAPNTLSICDSYIPEDKSLVAGYFCPIALQGILIPTDFPASIPITSPPFVSWYEKLIQWLIGKTLLPA